MCMNLQNPFSQDTRNLYLYCFNCFDCGRSDRGLELHHIASRISNSVYNSILLCKVCHNKCSHNENEEKKYFKITIKFHNKNGYKPNTKDTKFINNYKRITDIYNSTS